MEPYGQHRKQQQQKNVVFRKGGRLTNEHWTYKGQEIEVVNSFNYLGIVLTSGGSFIQASKTLADKALMVMYCLFECLKGTKI